MAGSDPKRVPAQPLMAKPGAKPVARQGSKPVPAASHKSAASKPLASKPVVGQPLTSKPVNSKPLSSRPPGSQPFSNKSPGSQPFASKLSGSRPLGSKPFGSKGPGGKPPVKGKASARSATRTPAPPRERVTLDGPWEWAFDRMVGRKRAAEVLAKQQAKQLAKSSTSKRAPEERTPPTDQA